MRSVFKLPSAEGGKRELLRIRSEENLFAKIIEMPKDESLQVTIEPYKKRLPTNLRARIKILVRELAAFHGYTYPEMNAIIHQAFYPRLDREFDGRRVEITSETNNLSPDEARIIEANLYDLGARVGCPLSLPQSKG